MQKNSSVVSGRIVIDDFHERYFLFVATSTQLTLDGKIASASSLPETDPEFTDRLRSIGINARAGFRLIRLLDDGPVTLPEDFPHALEHPGDSSRAVTVSGHIATSEEMRNHGDLTNPTIALERVLTFEAIQQRAFDVFRSGYGRSAVENWLRAERELLGLT
jgi:hypothetical protein